MGEVKSTGGTSCHDGLIHGLNGSCNTDLSSLNVSDIFACYALNFIIALVLVWIIIHLIIFLLYHINFRFNNRFIHNFINYFLNFIMILILLLLFIYIATYYPLYLIMIIMVVRILIPVLLYIYTAHSRLWHINELGGTFHAHFTLFQHNIIHLVSVWYVPTLIFLSLYLLEFYTLMLFLLLFIHKYIDYVRRLN